MDTKNFLCSSLRTLQSLKIRLPDFFLLLATVLVTGCNFSGPTSSGQVGNIGPIAIAGNSNGIVADSGVNLYYPDVDQGLVEKVSTDGIQTELASYGPTGGFGTIAIDSNDSIYVGHAWWTI